jgi:hypothetical protein
MDGDEIGEVGRALEQALADVAPALMARDAGMVALGRRLAAAIDADGDIAKLAPQLLNVLDALLMSPRARASVTRKGEKIDGRPDPLDELRDRRRARFNGAAALDQAAP